ncbi:MAG: hypothetical protein FJ399_18160 [Verrucomicrobia bacterium]|nr:hypothetical protein [Verrucomicrobiota bacterium]
MPSYPLTLPTNVHPEHVRVRRRTATGFSESPTSFKQQIYQHPGARWEIEVSLPPMPYDEADEWTQFFYDLQGRVGTFQMSLNAHCPGLSPAPGTVTFRLADPEIGWDSNLAREFGFSFRAVQAL